MTSKEIANKWQMNRYLTPHQDGGMDNKEFYEQLDDDISNYAKQQSIGFIEWISINGWYFNKIKRYSNRNESSDNLIEVLSATKSTEELYTLYQSQNK